MSRGKACEAWVVRLPYNDNFSRFAHFAGLFKNAQVQGPRVLRSEAYFLYAATTKGEGNAANGCFSTALLKGRELVLAILLLVPYTRRRRFPDMYL